MESAEAAARLLSFVPGCQASSCRSGEHYDAASAVFSIYLFTFLYPVVAGNLSPATEEYEMVLYDAFAGGD